MIHFRTRLFRALEQTGWVCRKKVPAAVLERKYQIVAGSLRTDDYDDAWLFALGLHSTTVFDVGCNVGSSALLLLYSDSIQELVLVDANAAALTICAENLILNGLSHRARFVRAFASDTSDSEVEFYTVGSGAAGSKYSSHAVTASDLGEVTRVRTTTLDSLCDRHGLVPDLVKIDVEGAEAEVLGGARGLAAKKKTRFMVEMHSNAQLTMEANAGLALGWCRAAGYAAWYLKTKEVVREAVALKDRGRCHLLLLPDGDAFPEFLQDLPQGATLAAVAAVHRRAVRA